MQDPVRKPGEERLQRALYRVAQRGPQDRPTLLKNLDAANLDPNTYDGASEVDFERDRSINLAFGGGPHLCLGINLARLELRVALEEWHRRIPDYSIPAGTAIAHSPGIRQADHLPLVWGTT